MASFLERLFGRSSSGSGSKAKERLQVVLIHDRFSLSPEKMSELKDEILSVISKYVQIDHKSVDITLERRDRLTSRIRAEIPFTPSRPVTDPEENAPDFLRASEPADSSTPSP